jgi:sulfatase maturation enzyme AslB (radical SAM superfamily)
MKDLYCSMIHGGLNLNFIYLTDKDRVSIRHCCLRKDLFPVDITQNFWKDTKLKKLRERNKQNIWDSGCSNCQYLEASNNVSMRTGMNHGLQITGQTNLSGPSRIDLMFDISCNLACRSCGPESSTYWQRHLKENKLWNQPVSTTRKKDEVIGALSKLDLSNLRQLVFCGGETLLGQEYWEVTEWLANNVLNAKEQLTVCFQTNGTQPIHLKNFKTIEKFYLVKLHISLDGITDRFEYLRWPASWSQVTDNILTLQQTLPGNVMFVVEETVSTFNLLYLEELELWIKNNFVTNREGDIINHTRHFAFGSFQLQNLTQEYVDIIKQSKYSKFIPSDWKENPVAIKTMVEEIKKFDHLRNESFEKTFPEVANLYARFL